MIRVLCCLELRPQLVGNEDAVEHESLLHLQYAAKTGRGYNCGQRSWPMAFRLFLAYLSQALYVVGSITCIWLVFRLIALLNAITRYFNMRAVKVDPTQPD